MFGLFGSEFDGYGWLTDTFSAPVVVLVLVLSGVLIGYGAKLAGGCTSGNGLSGNAVCVAREPRRHRDVLRHRDRRQLPDRGVALRRLAAFAVGAVFGLTLSWSGMTSPDVLRDGLLFRDPYLMLFFASATGDRLHRPAVQGASRRAPC